MANMKTGLSYFERGGEVDSTSESPLDTTEQPGVKVGTGKSAVIANENVLAQMQRLYEQKAAQQQGLGGFIETLKDATAWTSGGIHGPTEALGRRAEDKSKRAAELFDMQNKIAAQKAAIANRDAFFGTPITAVQPTSVAPAAGATLTTGTAPVAGGAAPGVTQANQQSGGLLGLVEDPALRQAIGATYLQDPTKAMTALNAHLAKRAEEPQVQKEIRYLTAPPPQGLGLSREKALPIAIAKVAGSGAFVPHDVRSAQGTVQTTPLQSAGTFAGAPSTTTAPVAGTTPGAPRAAAPSAAPSTGATSTTSTTATPSAGGTTVVPAQVTSSATKINTEPTGFAPGSQEDLKVKEERELAKIETLKKELGKTGEDIALQRAATVEAGGNAQDRLASIDYLGGLITTNPRAFGVLQRPGIMAAVLSVAQDGVNAGQLGAIGLKNLDDAIRKVGGDQQDIDAAQKAAREFALMQLNAAKIYLKGQGAVSDAERNLIKEMAGSTRNSPAAIRDFLEWNKVRADFDYKNGQAYSRFNEKYPGTSFEKYKQTPEYKALKAEYENNIRVFGKSTQPKPAQHPGKSLLDKYPSRNQ